MPQNAPLQRGTNCELFKAMTVRVAQKTIVQYFKKKQLRRRDVVIMWCRGVRAITIAQPHSPKPKLRFCVSSNPRAVSEICDGENF